MNLFNSILTSLFIVALVWGLAVYQGNIAHAFPTEPVQTTVKKIETNSQNNTANNLLLDNTSENTQLASEQSVNQALMSAAVHKASQNNTQTVHISGIKRTISLANIGQLWQQFNHNEKYHKALKQAPKQVYVLYSALSSNYQSAEVVIGYNVNELNQFDQHHSINLSGKTSVLPAKKHSEIALANAWQKINYSKTINYVLEVHHLNERGETTETQMFVSYL